MKVLFTGQLSELRILLCTYWDSNLIYPWIFLLSKFFVCLLFCFVCFVLAAYHRKKLVCIIIWGNSHNKLPLIYPSTYCFASLEITNSGDELKKSKEIDKHIVSILRMPLKYHYFLLYEF